MARTPQDKRKYSEFLTRTRCTPILKQAVEEAATNLGVSAGDVIRGCIGYMLKVDTDSRLIERIMENASSGSRPDLRMDREDEDE